MRWRHGWARRREGNGGLVFGGRGRRCLRKDRRGRRGIAVRFCGGGAFP